MSKEEALKIIASHRSMAWERAKGEMQSMVHTYYEDAHKLNMFEFAVKEFINYVESEGLHE